MLKAITVDAKRKSKAIEEFEGMRDLARTEMSSLNVEAAKIFKSKPKGLMGLGESDSSRRAFAYISDPLKDRLAKTNGLLLDQLDEQIQQLQRRIEFLTESIAKVRGVVREN